MSNPDITLSSGKLPSLQPISTSTNLPSISTFTPSQQNPSHHVTTTTPTPTPAIATTAKPPDYSQLHKSLRSNNLVMSTITTVPKLVSNENYINWSDQVVVAFCYCGIEKILTGEWKKPEVKATDASSEKEANEWGLLDAWITLHLNLLDSVWSQVCCQGHSHPKLPVSPSCTQQLLSTKDRCTPVGCP